MIAKTISLKELKKWIEEMKKDDYWTRGDDNGLLNDGKEICLSDLEEFLKTQSKEKK